MEENKEEEYDYQFKIVLVGDPETELLHRYVNGEYAHSPVNNELFYSKSKFIELDGAIIELEIWDPSYFLIKKFRAYNHNPYRSAHGIMILYSIYSQKSFAHVECWMEELYEFGSPLSLRFMIGHNYSPSQNVETQKRTVTHEQGQRVASLLNMPFMEVCSQTGENVDKAFTEMATRILQKLKPPEEPNLEVFISTKTKSKKVTKKQKKKQVIPSKWTPDNHKKFPKKFRESIYMFVLCLKRYQKDNKLAKIPKFVLFEIMKFIPIESISNFEEGEQHKKCTIC